MNLWLFLLLAMIAAVAGNIVAAVISHYVYVLFVVGA